MITIKVRQDPCPDWPDGWAVFRYGDTDREKMIAREHWEILKGFKSDAIWIGRITKTLQHGREV